MIRPPRTRGSMTRTMTSEAPILENPDPATLADEVLKALKYRVGKDTTVATQYDWLTASIKVVRANGLRPRPFPLAAKHSQASRLSTFAKGSLSTRSTFTNCGFFKKPPLMEKPSVNRASRHAAAAALALFRCSSRLPEAVLTALRRSRPEMPPALGPRLPMDSASAEKSWAGLRMCACPCRAIITF